MLSVACCCSFLAFKFKRRKTSILDGIGAFLTILAGFWLLLPACLLAVAYFCLLLLALLASARYCLLLLAFACFCLLLLASACFCLLLLVFACFCLLLLAVRNCRIFARQWSCRPFFLFRLSLRRACGVLTLFFLMFLLFLCCWPSTLSPGLG